MFSQFFVLSLRGDTILHKDCTYQTPLTHPYSQKRPRHRGAECLCFNPTDVLNTRRYPKFIRRRQRMIDRAFLCKSSTFE